MLHHGNEPVADLLIDRVRGWVGVVGEQAAELTTTFRRDLGARRHWDVDRPWS